MRGQMRLMKRWRCIEEVMSYELSGVRNLMSYELSGVRNLMSFVPLLYSYFFVGVNDKL